MNKSLDLDRIYTKFDDILGEFKLLLKSSESQEAWQYAQKLDEERRAIRENPVLRVAFIGQYSAGKSTIISALTGNRDIKIGADITTDKATPYSWNGLEILDTPGIGTEREDHDEVTYAAIERADLLVFCTTHLLLDARIIQHFRKLAYEKRYSHKMMLIFNKLAAEAGNDNEKIANYRASMMEALHPHSLDDFPVCFLDAQLYLKGVEKSNEKLISKSRFLTFVEELNKFIKERDKLAQLDTPIRRVLTYAEEVERWFVNRPEQDNLFFEALTQISRRIRDERRHLNIEAQRIALDANVTIRSLGSEFVNDLPEFKSESDLEQRSKEIGLRLEELQSEIEKDLERVIESSVDSLRDEIADVLNSEFISDFTATIGIEQEITRSSVPPGFDVNSLRQQVNGIGNIAEQFGLTHAKVAGQATRSFIKIPGGGGFLRGIDVVGSDLHRSILGFGKAIGFKFKPWQAVGIVKNLGNAAKLAGPLLGLIAFGFDIWETLEQQGKAKQMREAQGEVDREFVRIAREAEQKIKEQVQQFEAQTYDYIEVQIRDERKKYTKQQIANSEQAGKLRKIQQQLIDLIQDLRYGS